MDHLAWITLGSNIDPAHHLPRAIVGLSDCGEIVNVSSVWQSAAVGDSNQADFLNAAALLRTPLLPRELKLRLRELEAEQGRVRDPSNKNAARTIDLDIALFDDIVLEEDGIRIPDPELTTRPFLAVPLAELTPEKRSPPSQRTLREIAEELSHPRTLQRRTDISLAPLLK